jgi:hypothetical protein
MVVDVLVATTGAATGGIASTQGSPVTITGISGNNVTFSSSFGPATTTLGVFRFGNRGLEPTGLAQIVSPTLPLHNLDPATTPIWAANRIQGAAPGTPEALTELRMITMVDNARRKGGATSAIFTSLGVRRSYFSVLRVDRQFTGTIKFPGGFEALNFSSGHDIPVVEDPDAPPNKMWFIDEPKIRYFRKKEWAFADPDGDVLKWIRDFDQWEGFMKCYYEIGTSQRNAHGVLEDITES